MNAYLGLLSDRRFLAFWGGFTISAVVSDAQGLPLGVLGADVNFQKLVGGVA